jgi:hypothetical protein
MTRQEYEEKLRGLGHVELQKFYDDLDGEQKTIEGRVREFNSHPEYERRICQLLGLKTEAEKLTDAALRSANAAVQSAASAKRSVFWSGIACIAAIAAVVVAIIGLIVKC